MAAMGLAALFRFLDEDFLSALDKLTLKSPGIDSTFYYLTKAELYRIRKNSNKEYAYFDSARIALQKIVNAQPDEAYFRSFLGIALAATGHKKEAIKEGKTAIKLLPVTKDAWEGSDLLWLLAEIYVITGEYKSAIDQIEEALAIPSIMSRKSIKIDELWYPLYDDPRFQNIINTE